MAAPHEASIDRSTTNTPPSNPSTPAMSAHQNDELEKGPRSADPQNLADAQEPEKNKTAPAGPPPNAPLGPPPDGGLQAWMTVTGAFCGLFVSFGWINCE